MRYLKQTTSGGIGFRAGKIRPHSETAAVFYGCNISIRREGPKVHVRHDIDVYYDTDPMVLPKEGIDYTLHSWGGIHLRIGRGTKNPRCEWDDDAVIRLVSGEKHDQNQ